MLARRFRLKNREDFRRLRKRGRKLSNRHALLIYVPARDETAQSLFGFTASRRIGNAVIRNRAKRLMREGVRQRISRIEPGWISLLVAKHHMTTASSTDVNEAVDSLLIQAGILRKI